jgi:endonuclease YncB( thermonuclease family)
MPVASVIPSSPIGTPSPRGEGRAVHASIAFALLALLLAACGPKIGELEKGERGRVVRVANGDTLELEGGLRVFLAEIDAPRGEEDYAAQARAELEALTLHRTVQLAYGGERRWVGRPREGDTAPPPQAAIAHVFVQSEGGGWSWVQHELIARGGAYVRPRRDNHTRTSELLALEAQARADERGLWGRRGHGILSTADAAQAALAFNETCTRGAAPYRIVEGRVADVMATERRAILIFDGEPRFEIAVFGQSFAAWDGPAWSSLEGARVRVRGSLGVYNGAPQLCLDHASALEIQPT